MQNFVFLKKKRKKKQKRRGEFLTTVPLSRQMLLVFTLNTLNIVDTTMTETRTSKICRLNKQNNNSARSSNFYAHLSTIPGWNNTLFLNLEAVL